MFASVDDYSAESTQTTQAGEARAASTRGRHHAARINLQISDAPHLAARVLAERFDFEGHQPDGPGRISVNRNVVDAEINPIATEAAPELVAAIAAGDEVQAVVAVAVIIPGAAME